MLDGLSENSAQPKLSLCPAGSKCYKRREGERREGGAKKEEEERKRQRRRKRSRGLPQRLSFLGRRG